MSLRRWAVREKCYEQVHLSEQDQKTLESITAWDYKLLHGYVLQDISKGKKQIQNKDLKDKRPL